MHLGVDLLLQARVQPVQHLRVLLQSSNLMDELAFAVLLFIALLQAVLARIFELLDVGFHVGLSLL